MTVINLKSTFSFKPVTLKFPRKSFTHPPLLWLIPALAVMAGGLLPLTYLFLRASEAGVVKIANILFHPRTLQVLAKSSGLALSVTLTTMALGLLLAWLTIRTDLPGRKFWSVATVLPLALPSYVGAFTFIAALGPKGILQQWLQPLGVDRLPSIYGFPGAWLALTLFTYPYVLLSVRAALRGLDPALEEAARSLGRTPLQVFWQITLPHLRPSLLAGGLLVALYTLSDFGAVSLLQFDTFTRVIYLQYSASFDRSVAAVLSLLLVALTVSLLIGESRIRGRARQYQHPGVRRQTMLINLKGWRWPATIFCGAITLLGVALPVLVIGFWFIRGWLSGETLHLAFGTILNSVSASGLAAMVAIVAAVPVAILAVRFPGAFSRLTERSTYLGYALPGIVMALALVFFGAHYAPALYQTLALLVLAYVLRFLPQAVGSSRTSLLQISPRLQEAAQSLGQTPFRTLYTITMPLLKPGLLTGMALVFLTGMKELPMTLLLGPTGFQTLATRIWAATEEAFFARAAAPALLLLIVSAISVWIILRQEEKGYNNP